MKRLALLAGVLVLSGAFVLAQNPVADQNAKKPRNQNNQGQPITGKTQANTGTPAAPVTTTGSAGQNTPGAETEAGAEQRPGRNVDVPHTGPDKPNAKKKIPAAPHNEAEAGQAVEEADINAQAASRAEIQPGTTLGVNGTADTLPNPGSSAQAQARGLPKTEVSPNAKPSQATGAKKPAAQPKPKTSQ